MARSKRQLHVTSPFCWTDLILGFGIHTLGLGIFRVLAGPACGPEADPISVRWGIWLIVDLPISLLYYPITISSRAEFYFMSSAAVFGGIQWILWVLLIRLALGARKRG